MKNLAKVFGIILAITFTTLACAAGLQGDKVHPSLDGKSTVYSGEGLQSLQNELAQQGIDINKLRALDAEGNIITPFTPGAKVTWYRTIDNATLQTGGGKLHANSLADGGGYPGEIEVDTVTHGTTVYVFTWQYQQLANGSFGWVALGVTSYTIQANTSQK